MTEECKLIKMTVEKEINKSDNEADKLQNLLLPNKNMFEKSLSTTQIGQSFKNS